jgi:hypothetical protein
MKILSDIQKTNGIPIMKTSLIILFLAFVCSAEYVGSLTNNGIGGIHIVKVKGHEYIVATNNTSQSGICIIHSESCPCHRTKKIVRDTVYIIEKPNR